MANSYADDLQNIHHHPDTLLKVGHWNLHSDLRALREGLVGEQHGYSRTWYNRRQYVVGTLMELLTKCDVVVTTENTHFWWILHTLQLGDANIEGVFCATTAPSDHVRGLYEAYRLHTLSLDESICFEDQKELFSQVLEHLESYDDVCHDEQYDTVNAWYHFEQNHKTIDALKCTLGWSSYDEERVPAQMRPMSAKGNDLYVSTEGIGVYWNSKRIKHVATLNHDDVRCIRAFPCNDHAITGHRFLVLNENHIVDVFGAQLADGSTIDKEAVDDRVYEAGLKRLILWMHSYDHSHVDQQIACVSHIGYSADGEQSPSLSHDDLIGKGIDYDALLIEPASLEALPDDVALVDVLPVDVSTSVCRLRSQDGQLTVDTLDRIIVRTGRIYETDSSDQETDTETDSEHATKGCAKRGPLKHVYPAISHPLTYGTISDEMYSMVRDWARSLTLRRALRNGARFEEWCEYSGANYVPDQLNRLLPGIDGQRSFDSVMHSLYPNSRCWSDHPPVTVCIPDRDTAAYLEPTIGSKSCVSGSRKRSRCNCFPTLIGTVTSVSTYMLHTRMKLELTTGYMLALQSVTAACLVYSGWAVGCS